MPTSAPANVKVNTTSSSLIIDWDPVTVSDHNGVIRNYLVYVRQKLQLSDPYDVYATPTTSILIDGLKPLTDYVFRVLAYTDSGNGLATDLQVARTGEDGKWSIREKNFLFNSGDWLENYE